MLHFSLKAINHRVREKSAHIFSQTELRAAAPTLDCPAAAAAAGFSTQCYRRQKVCFSFSSSERKMSNHHFVINITVQPIHFGESYGLLADGTAVQVYRSKYFKHDENCGKKEQKYE